MDPAIFVLSKLFAVLVEGVPPFKDSVDGSFENLLWTTFVLSGPSRLSICQTVAKWAEQMNREHNSVFEDPVLLEQLQLMPSALLLCVDALENVLPKFSKMTQLLWLKAWSKESACKRCHL